MCVRAVVFDLGNVLIHLDPSRAIRAMMRDCPRLLERDIRDFFSRPDLADRYEKGKMTNESFYHYAADSLKCPISYDAFTNAWNGIFTPVRPMIDLLGKLQPVCRLILCSNTNPLHAAYCIRTFAFLSCFETLIFSCEAGLRKPEPAIYRLILEKAGLPPASCVFVDDLPDNVDGAVNAGMKGILFVSHDQLIEELNQLGIAMESVTGESLE